MTTKQFTVTTFATAFATKGHESQVTWEGLVQSLKDDDHYFHKRTCPLFRVGRWGGKHRKRGAVLLEAGALMGDYDAEKVSIDEAADLLKGAGIKAVLYTSASHTPETPRWRVVAPLAAPTTDQEVYQSQMSVLNGALGGVLGPESWDWRRNFFRGQVEGVEYVVREVDGGELDTLIGLGVAPDPINAGARVKKARTAPKKRRTKGDPAAAAVAGPGALGGDPDGEGEEHVLLEGDDPVGSYLAEHGWVMGRDQDKLFVRCPLAEQHSNPQEDGDTSAAWLAPTNLHPHGSYACLHQSHGTIGRTDFLRLIGYYDPKAEFEAMGPEPDPPGEEGGRFRLIPFSEFNRRPAPGWLIKHVMPKAQLMVIYGPPGSGKSFVALDMAMSIARGIPWRGHKARPGKVVYVAAEGAGGFRNRTSAYGIVNGFTEMETFNVIGDAPSLLNMDWKGMAESIRDASVIVIDTLSSTTPGGDENSAETMTMVVDRCRRLSVATGALVILIHHSGKDVSKGSRGHSSLLAACDAEFEVTKDGTFIQLRNTKQKDGEDGQRWGFKLRQVLVGIDQDEDGEDTEITSCVVEEAELPPAKTGGRPLSPYAEAINEVIQEMAEAQTTGIEVKAIRDEVKRRQPAGEHAHFSRALKGLCKQLGYEIEGDSLSVGEV